MEGALPEKQPVRVTILSRSYTLLTGGDPREVEELAAGVDALMLSIAAKAPNADSTRIAVLACLHLADKLRLPGARDERSEAARGPQVRGVRRNARAVDRLRGTALMFGRAILAGLAAAAAFAATPYEAEIAAWRQAREAGSRGRYRLAHRHRHVSG